MNKVLLVTGGSGLVGSNVAWVNKENYDVILTWNSKPVSIPGCRSEKLNILDKDNCVNLIKKYKPDYVVHSAVANWGFEACEQDTEGISRLGIVGATENILEGCKKVGAKLVFFSTDWVFDGTKPAGQSYSEEDPTHAICKYGEYKVECEDKIRKSLEEYLILRVAHVYGYNYAKCGKGTLWSEEDIKGNSNAFKLANQLRLGVRVKQTADVLQNATLATEIGKGLGDLLEKKSTGLFHLSGRDPVSRTEFFRTMARVFNLDPALVEEGSVEEFLMLRGADEKSAANLAKRFPRNTAFSVEKIEKTLQRRMLTYKEGLAALAEQVAGRI